MSLFSSLGHFASNVCKAAGHAVGSAVHLVNKATGDIGKGIASIPFVGGPLHAIYTFALGPLQVEFAVTDAILSGQRIDRAVLNGLNQALTEVKEVGPYVQAVISVIPEVGPVVSGGIGLGLSLASGDPLDESLANGLKSALPGGPLAAAAFDMGDAAISGKKPLQIVAAGIGDAAAATGIPIPPQVISLIQTGATLGADVASGKTISTAELAQIASTLPASLAGAAELAKGAGDAGAMADEILTKASTLVPKISPQTVQQFNSAMKLGMAVAHGQNLQDLTKKALDNDKTLNQLVQIGQQIEKTDKVIASARLLIPAAGQRGFDAGVGFSQHQVTGFAYAVLRAKLSPAEQVGFDSATALHVGRVTVPPKSTVPMAVAGQAITHGVQGGAPAQKAAVIKNVIAHPVARTACQEAIGTIADARKHEGWWLRLRQWLGFSS